jgi:hypothetical protein
MRNIHNHKRMPRQVDFALTLQPNEVADLANINKYWWWSGWRRRHWPADMIRPGLRLYAFDKRSRCFVAVLEVTRGGAFKYRTGEEFRRRVFAKTGRYPDRYDPHWNSIAGDGRSKRIGIALRWKLIRKVNESWVGKFPRLGWMRLTESIADPEAADRGNPDPKRVTTQQSRIVRETAQIRYLKRLHDHSCQLCGTRLSLAGGLAYSEGHHLRPLGTPHNGPDIPSNIIIVCPNCHTLCDFGAVRLDARRLRRRDGHTVANVYVRYHNSQIAMPRRGVI